MTADPRAIADLLDGTFDPQRNKEAEIALRRAERSTQFSLILLQIASDGSYSYATRLAGALCFKNYIKRNWVDEDGNHKLPPDEVAAVKQEIVGIMISVPSKIQSQLGDAISLIAESDFWRRWDTLIDDLVARLTLDNAVVNNGVLQVAHSIFKRWRPLYRSDELFTEINHVLTKFGLPFLTLFESTDRMIEENKDNRDGLQAAFGTLILLVKLFYDLSCQDLPPIFEDHLQAITKLLQKYLDYDNPLLRTTDDAEPGPLEFVKAGICEVLTLYAQKFEEEFGQFLGEFIASVWNVLTTTGAEAKYDILVSKALQFLTTVARIRQHAEKFNNDGVLGHVVDNVILPNVSLRDADIEMLEDEPIEFIRRDLEGSDADTRRRAATDFLRQLLEHFEKLVTQVVMVYVDRYISQYRKDPARNWRSKDTAVYLFCAIAAKGVVTASRGVKGTNSLVNIIEFFEAYVAEDLVKEQGGEYLPTVDAIKYLYVFRSQMTKAQLQVSLPLLMKHLSTTNYVVHTYAAIAIERILFLSDGLGKPMFTKEDVLPMGKDMLGQLFRLIQEQGAPEKVQENEFLMRCVMRILIVVRDGVLPMADTVLNQLNSITGTISRNPSNPRFYYYHFEALGAVIRFVGPSQPEKIDNILYPQFAAVLQDDVQEFIPYVFQLFAAILETNPSGALTERHQSLIPPILMPALWESKGNIPALVRLLSAVIARGPSYLVANSQVEPVLGIFQKLISTKANESHAFDVIEAVITHIPVSALQPYFVPMLNMMLMRLHKSRTETFAVRFVRFYHFMSARDKQGLGADFVIHAVDQVQEGVFAPLYTSVILPESQKLARPADRKMAVISFCKTLADSAAFSEKYKKGWAYTCDTMLKLLETPPVPLTAADDIQEQDVDDLSFGIGFTALSTCRRPPQDPWPEITDPKRWVGETLKEANVRHGSKIQGYMQERLSDEARSVLLSYMQT